MDKLVEFVINNLQPIIDSVKANGADVIRRELEYMIWVTRLCLGIGWGLGVLSLGMIGWGIWGFKTDRGDYRTWPGIVIFIGAIMFVIAAIMIPACYVELRHININPTYMLIRRFMGSN